MFMTELMMYRGRLKDHEVNNLMHWRLGMVVSDGGK